MGEEWLAKDIEGRTIWFYGLGYIPLGRRLLGRYPLELCDILRQRNICGKMDAFVSTLPPPFILHI